MRRKDIALYQNLRTKLTRACHRYFDQKIRKSKEQRFIGWRLVFDTLIIEFGDSDIHEIEIDLDEFIKYTEQMD